MLADMAWTIRNMALVGIFIRATTSTSWAAVRGEVDRELMGGVPYERAIGVRAAGRHRFIERDIHDYIV